MLKAFNGPSAHKSAERSGHWLKSLAGDKASREWCIRNGIPLTKASSESLGTGGGFTVPVDFDSAIIAVRDATGAFRNAEVRKLRSDSGVRPRRTGGLTANFVAEGAPIPESQMQFDAVGAALRKIAILSKVSSELFEDEAAELADFIGQEIGYAFAAKEDDVGFNGDGTSAYAGQTGLGVQLVGKKSAITASSGHNTFATLDSTDLGALMGGVIGSAIPGAKWYISEIGYAQAFCRLAGVSGGLVARQLPDGSIQASYLGFPVAFSAQLPNVQTTLSGKPMLYFGNLKQSSVIVESKAGTVLSTSAERYLDTDQVAVRGVRREHLVNHSVGDANTFGPIAMLVGG